MAGSSKAAVALEFDEGERYKAAFMELASQHLFNNLHTLRFTVQGLKHQLDFKTDQTVMAYDCRVLGETLEAVQKFYEEMLDLVQRQIVSSDRPDWSALARWDNTGKVVPRFRDAGN